MPKATTDVPVSEPSAPAQERFRQPVHEVRESPEQRLVNLKRAYSAAVLDGKTTRNQLEAMRQEMRKLAEAQS